MKQLLFYITSLMLAFLSCSIDDSFSGTAESGNAKVVGVVINELGYPAENTVVSLIPEDYNSVIQGELPDSLIDITDEYGQYRFSVSDSGYFNIMAKHSGEGTGLLVRSIYLRPDTIVTRNDTLNGLEKLILSVPENSDPVTGYIYIEGTNEYVQITEGSNQVVFDSMPVGFVPSVYYINIDDISNTVLFAESDDIEITIGNITFHGKMAQWEYRKKVYINTTSTGANIVNNVFEFPLLIRLDSSNFSFNEALGNGQDIRFTKRDSIFLPHEIEQWNATAGKAEIWVRVDTVCANNDVQYINIYWGNAAATDSGNPSQVFDTSDGFCGVWHFPPSDIFSDATANNSNGTNFGSSGDAGIIGDARTFDGKDDDDYISCGTSSTLRPVYTMTLQAWVKPSSTPLPWDGIVGNFWNNGIGYQSGYAFAYVDSQWRFTIMTESMTGNDWDDNPGSSSVLVNSWSHLTGTYDGTIIKFYLNGTLVASESKTGKINWDFLPIDFVIGMYKDSDEAYEYTGSLDEIRVLKKACSDDWIKLCYETQKPGSKVVKLR